MNHGTAGSSQTERPSTPPSQVSGGISRPLSSPPPSQAVNSPQPFFGSLAPSFSTSGSLSFGVPSLSVPSHLSTNRSSQSSPPPGSPPLSPSSFAAATAAIPIPQQGVLAEPPPESLTTNADSDLSFDDDGLSTLEKIYLFSRSQATYHRKVQCCTMCRCTIPLSDTKKFTAGSSSHTRSQHCCQRSPPQRQ